MIILNEVKTALGITGPYMDGILEQYIREVKEYMLDAGVRQGIIESTSAKGLITRGVADLWNYGQGDAKLSDYFKMRVIQMASKECECGCVEDGYFYLADLPVVDSLVEGDLFLIEKNRVKRAITSDDIKKYFKGDKGATGNDAEIAGAGAHYEDTGSETPSVTIETSGPASSRYFDFYFKDLRGPKGTSVESIKTTVKDGVYYLVFTMNDGTSAEVATPYIRFTEAMAVTVDGTTGTPSGMASLTFEEVDGIVYATIHLSLSGLKGEKGDKGDTGDTGATGATGATGEQGPEGPKGDTGATGATGEQGPKGDKGDKGDTGPEGPKGDSYVLTDADKTTIANEVIALLGNAEDGSY